MSEERAFLAPHHAVVQERLRDVTGPPDPEGDPEARLEARRWLARLKGLVDYAIEPEYAGSGPDFRALCLIREALAARSPLADSTFALQCLGSMPLTLGGSSRLKREWLPQVLKGEAMAAFAMTEPEAGSDVAAMRTVAARHGQEWRLTGTKHLISNAGLADFYCVFARTEPKLSCFLVRGEHVRFVRPQVMSAPHPLGEIALDEAPGELLGGVGDGMKLGLRTLDGLRCTVGAAACGMARGAFEAALAHVRGRQQFGAPLAEMPVVQHSLGAMAMELAAARLLVYRAAWEKDNGAPRITMEAAMAKCFATEAAQRIVDGCLQLFGGRGVLLGHPVEHLYRAVRALRIYEGTSEVQHQVIARALLA